MVSEMSSTARWVGSLGGPGQRRAERGLSHRGFPFGWLSSTLRNISAPLTGLSPDKLKNQQVQKSSKQEKAPKTSESLGATSVRQ